MNENTSNGNIQAKIQKFGRFLSGMVMPNIGAFIAWGLITALFIPTGWLPNEGLAKLVGPMITFLLPLLIGYTGGKAVAGTRGGVLGAIATSGVIIGADIPMFIGAMIMGPLAGWVIKKFDQIVEGSVPVGFEMLVNNFSAGIIGGILAIIAYTGVGPVVLALNSVIRSGVDIIVTAGMLPIASLFIEPGKILFLNNAMNHGILSPIGIQQAQETGKSIFFLLEPNPGPGLGLLLAYWVFAKGMAKDSAPGAIIIHFLGGIHEIYFPYVLMNPILLLAVIAGGMSGVFTFVLLGGGLVATPAPGSIFAILALTPKGVYFANIAGVVVSTVVSFLVASVFVKRSANQMDDSELEAAKGAVSELKGNKNTSGTVVAGSALKKIIYACDAGMGSSAMGASALKNKLKKAGYTHVSITNCAIEDIPADAQIVVTHEKLATRVQNKVPQAEHIFVKDFIQNQVYDIISARLAGLEKVAVEVNNTSDTVIQDQNLLTKNNIKVGLTSVTKAEAIRMAGRMLVDSGYAEEPYVEAMIEREQDISTYIGRGIAIPHGVSSAKNSIKKSGLVVLQFPDGIDFGEETAYLIVGIAGKDNEHLAILANIATALDEYESKVKELYTTKDKDLIYKLFTNTNE
ncbi:PTS mannitol transporter subunit IICBA [Propionispira raffinosivorans]|uniref:PTS mannitol transporter subunit IICBA n=1 Tax=Propionispira raffinosivorans TaxID=86959 RepID=UPI000361381B|nr:PTS mannitol transporter subunit IICBA [Propionispira raffinosivorans]